MRSPITLGRQELTDYAKSGRAVALVMALAYSAVMWFDYKNYIHPEFEYMAFVFYRHSPKLVLLDFALAAAPTLFMPLRVRRPSDLALTLIYIIVYIPSIILTTSAVTIVGSEMMTMKITMLFSMALMVLVAGGDQYRKLVILSLKPNQLMLGFLALGVLCVGVLGKTYGFSIQLHNFKDVYTQRADFKEQLADAGYATYVVGLVGNVLGPGLVSYGLVFRKPVFIAAGAFFALYVFSITGLKSSILALLYTFTLFAGLTFARRSFLSAALAATLGLTLFAMAASAIPALASLNSLFVRRTFMIQGLLTTYYHDYYSAHPFLYLAQSVLGPFFQMHDILDPEGIIGQVYFHGGEHANASLWADGFLNAGIFGMLVSALLVALFLRGVNYCLSRADLRFASCAMSMVFFMMCETGIIKVIGTHGGLIACLLYLQADMRKAAPASARNVLARAAARRGQQPAREVEA